MLGILFVNEDYFGFEFVKMTKNYQKYNGDLKRVR